MQDLWPELSYQEWEDTYITLHMWTQIIGKVKLELCPFLNEWWQVAFLVTSRGMSALSIPFEDRIFEVHFDFIDHKLNILVSDGQTRTLALKAQSVAEFYAAF